MIRNPRVRAELHNIGGILDILEERDIETLRKKIISDFIPNLMPGDIIRVAES